MKPSGVGGKRKIISDDVTRLQYEVLLEQKKKLSLQCQYYELMDIKLRKEMEQ